MTDFELPDALRDEARAAWQRYLDLVEPIRPALHRYSLGLARNLWDAEDLVQESLLRGFAALGNTSDKIQNPRSYLLRIATNLWIDRTRRAGRETPTGETDDAIDTGPDVEDLASVRDAGAVLLERLAPRERAAVLLKDVFDCSLGEAAEVLGSTIGAVKSALHRGRLRLAEEAPTTTPNGRPRAVVSVALVDRFVEAFDRRDRPALLELMLENVTTEVFGAGLGQDPNHGWLDAVLNGHPRWPSEWHWESSRIERALYEGEPIILVFRTKQGVEAFEELWRFEEEDGRVAWVRDYGFCPETLAIVAEHFGLPLRTGGYRLPTPEPGGFY